MEEKNQDPNKISFSIESKTDPKTGRPFGSKYAGEFCIRRATIADKQNIATRDAAVFGQFGPVVTDLIPAPTKTLSYIFTFLSVVAEKKLPDWFDPAKLYTEEDEGAVVAVWEEVLKFLESFRL